MSFDQKEPYHSIRIHIGELDKKGFVGVKTRSIEVVYGNQSKRKIVKNSADIADIEERDIAQEVITIWNDITSKGHEQEWKFLEDVSQ